METWKRQLADSITLPEELPPHLAGDLEQLREVVSHFPMRVTPYYLGLIRHVGDPIWRQCMPDPLELSDDQLTDPLNETGLSPVPGLIHRYPDRVVVLISSQCSVYCRFCMRKGRVGCANALSGTVTRFAPVLDYIAANEAVRDVILSGGDPLLLEDDVLEAVLAKLHSIPHVEIIRIGTRIPVTLPQRITARLCRMLKRYHPLYINTHFNHPLEITAESGRACGRLADAGIPLGNQTVLLSGVNDDPPTMTRLMQQLLATRVRPYYIHQMDLVKGTRHFRTTVARGVKIMEALRGHTSGLANPHYVIDVPGGKGKVPVGPDCVRRKDGGLLLTNYLGEVVEYEEMEG
jgi:lysine 2,3-aminomutase